ALGSRRISVVSRGCPDPLADPRPGATPADLRKENICQRPPGAGAAFPFPKLGIAAGLSLSFLPGSASGRTTAVHRDNCDPNRKQLSCRDENQALIRYRPCGDLGLNIGLWGHAGLNL